MTGKTPVSSDKSYSLYFGCIIQPKFSGFLNSNFEFHCANIFQTFATRNEMKSDLTNLLYSWMKELSVDISKDYLHKKLLAHPDYPSLLSITDTLHELGIHNEAYEMERAGWDLMSFPFLAHTAANGGQFVVVQKNDKDVFAKGGKLEHWDGIVVFAQKPENWVNQEINKDIRRKKIVRTGWFAVLFFLVMAATIALVSAYQLTFVFFLATTVTGLGLSILIVQKELGFTNPFTEKICALQKEGDCQAVIASKGSNLTNWLAWSDVGLIYFSTVLFLLVNINPLVLLIPAFAVPFIPYSLYYQRWVLKKWCTLCLFIIVILTLQIATVWPFFSNSATDVFSIQTLSQVLFTGIAIAAMWLGVVKPLLRQSKEGREDFYRLLRFKNKPEMFESLLTRQRRIDSEAWSEDLQLGNPVAAIQILVACNPYCTPCARTHDYLHELLKKRDIGLTVRFAVNPRAMADPRTIATYYLLQAVKDRPIQYKREALHYWYSIMDLEKFQQRYQADKNALVEKQVYKHYEWSKSAQLAFTPAIFINGYELPAEYRASELSVVLSSLSLYANTVEFSAQIATGS